MSKNGSRSISKDFDILVKKDTDVGKAISLGKEVSSIEANMMAAMREGKRSSHLKTVSCSK